MKRIIFLLEEYSMKVFLDGLLPRFFPELSFLCVPHQGKQDLEKSVPRKLKVWNEPALAEVYGDGIERAVMGKARFRDPDAIDHPSRALEHLAPSFQKVGGARALSARLSAERNTSRSFRFFLEAVRTLMDPDPRETI